MKAVIMAGGFGTRLRPLTCNFPKPMVPMVGVPIICHILNLLKKHGLKDIVIMLYYQPEQITTYFGNGEKFGVNISYLRPESDLGTAGCIKFADKELRGDSFLVISGDLLTDFDLSKVIEFHEKKKAVATMVLTRVTNPLAYGVVITNEENGIERFLEKPSWGEVFSDTINTGIYILNEEILDMIPLDKSFDFSNDLYPRVLADKKPFYGYIAEGFWRDIGNLDEYRLAHYSVLDESINIDIPLKKTVINNVPVWIGEDTIIEKDVEFTAATIIGNNCRIKKGTKIGQSVIGNSTTIGTGTTVLGSVIWDDVDIGHECNIAESIIAYRSVIKDHAEIKVGTVISDECIIGESAVVQANVKIWPKKLVEDGAILSTSLVWGEKWAKSLFGAYGISGLANIEITPEFATKVGAAYGAYLGKSAYVITSRDAHPAARMIKRSIIAGLLSAGVKAGDLRTAPIPVVRYELGKEGESGGIHVRQSPYDPRLMDIKFFSKDGSDMPIRQEKAIEQLFLREDFHRVAPEQVGLITMPSRTYEYYRDGFLKTIKKDVISKNSFKIILDYAYSSAALVFPSLLGELGCEVVALNSYVDPRKVTKSEKEFTHSLEQLSDIVITLKADIGFLIDTGAEKVFLVDDRGKIIPDQLGLALVSRMVMEEYPTGMIGVPVNASQVIEEMATNYPIKVMRTRTLPRYIMEAARGKDMVFVGDGMGGFIFPEFQPAFDALYTIGKIMELMAKLSVRLSRLSRDVPGFKIWHERIPCPWDKKGKIMRELIAEAKDKKADYIDGVKIFFGRDWVLLIPDADEPFMHIWIEAERDHQAQTLMEEYKSKVKQWMQ